MKSQIEGQEADRVSRLLLIWLNRWPDKPVRRIEYEYLDDEESMALSLVQGAYKSGEYILGGYEAAYQFKVVYRLSANTIDRRLSADEKLNALSDWITSSAPPVLGDNITRVKFTANARSALFGRYDDGTEDHQILMTMTYEENV